MKPRFSSTQTHTVLVKDQPDADALDNSTGDYHLTSRGDRREDIYHGDADRRVWPCGNRLGVFAGATGHQLEALKGDRK